jgi:hypothetical protein
MGSKRKRMKFFNSHITILKSSYQPESSAYPCGVPNTLEPSHRSSYLYSTLRNQLPKSADPSNAVSTSEILVASGVNCDLSNALPNYSHSKTVGTQCADEHGLYSQHLSEFLHSRNRKLGLSNRDNGTEYRQLAHDNDTSLSIPNERSVGLHYACYGDTLSQLQRYKKFIETKSSCTKVQGFNR